MSIVLLILGIVLFIGLVVAHEFGHFIMARRNGVEVEEFGIFFPPRLYKHKTKGGWLFTINLLPLGGFVKLKGEHDTDTAKGTYGAASLSAKTKIMAAGVVVNLAIGLVLLLIISLIGMPQIVPNQFQIKADAHTVKQAHTAVLVDDVQSGSPAKKAGLKYNDQITAVGPVGHIQKIDSVTELQSVTTKYAGESVKIEYKRGNKHGELTTILNSTAAVNASKKTSHPTGYLGVTLAAVSDGLTTVRSTWSAPIVAVGTAWQFTVLTFQGLGHALAGVGGIIAGTATHNTEARQSGQTEASSQVGGPVAIFFVLKDGAALGPIFILFVIAIVSLTLAIMNILPIPALDGGRLWLTLITRGIKKPLTPEREELINGIGFFSLLGLIILITVVDVKRFF